MNVEIGIPIPGIELQNPAYEKFAHSVANGNAIIASYVAVGFLRVPEFAHALASQKRIAARITELKPFYEKKKCQP